MPPPEDGVATSASTSDSQESVAGEKNGKPVRYFTWKELSRLNRPENAHVAVRGKVARCLCDSESYLLHVTLLGV